MNKVAKKNVTLQAHSYCEHLIYGKETKNTCNYC